MEDCQGKHSLRNSRKSHNSKMGSQPVEDKPQAIENDSLAEQMKDVGKVESDEQLIEENKEKEMIDETSENKNKPSEIIEQ